MKVGFFSVILFFISLFLYNYNRNNNHNGGNYKIRTCTENKYTEISEKLSDIVKALGEFFTDLRAEACWSFLHPLYLGNIN